jgi:N-acetylglucosaminyldiphosphoundecaprenol N-acetyl-beta-D-mannosaminyltransferase
VERSPHSRAADEAHGAASPAPRGASKRDPALAPFGSRRILGMRVDATSYADAARAILDMAESGHGGTTCVATVHMVMEAFDAPDFQRLVNAAELVTSDGVPLVWALRRLGIPRAQRVYGPDLTPIVCREAARRGVPVGFYGGHPEVLETLTRTLAADISGLRIAFAHSPPFAPLSAEEDAKLTAAIVDSGARVLFVGLGCPKQERWMASHRERLPCAMLGVGAAFDFLAGYKRQAPRWMQNAGLEWLFRLLCEPRRLWHRYAVHNPRFAFHLARQLARERQLRPRGAG